jgi:hypothetical protein
MLKRKQLNVKLSLDELNIIKSKIDFYKNEGVKLNVSKIVRNVLLNFPTNE